MYKTRNTRTGNAGNGRNVAKHSREYRQTLRGVSPNITGNVAKHSGECPQTSRGMSPNIPGSVAKRSVECSRAFRGMFSSIPGNVFVTQGDEEAGPVQDFMEFVIQNIAWNL